MDGRTVGERFWVYGGRCGVGRDRGRVLWCMYLTDGWR